MQLKIQNKTVERYNDVAVSLQYDSVASTFGFSVHFDPDRADHRELFRPCSYAPVTIEHQGETLITGTLLNHKLQASPVPHLLEMGGYSKPGVLEDCQIPVSLYPLQTNGLSLERICRRLIEPFGIGLVVDPLVQARAAESYRVVKASDDQTIKSYLSELAGQKHIILSHDAAGNLLLTEAAADSVPVWDFAGAPKGFEFILTTDGQRMHSEVNTIKQATKGRKDGTGKKGNAGQAEVFNPYVTNVFRPSVSRQTSGEYVDTPLAARNMLSDELKSVVLTVQMQGWTLGGKIIRPNTFITVTNPDLFLYQKTKFFIAQVDYKGTSETQSATLTCYLPEVYSRSQPKNIFL